MIKRGNKPIYREARRATLEPARILYNVLKLTFEGQGYTVCMGGSVLAVGSGRDIDIIMIRQVEHALPPAEVMATLDVLGFERVLQEGTSHELGFIGIWHEYAVDVSLMGWGAQDV
jgi:hypothetical protein